jgi:hypothetical protein
MAVLIAASRLYKKDLFDVVGGKARQGKPDQCCASTLLAAILSVSTLEKHRSAVISRSVVLATRTVR